jgi:hypothetical protein
MEMMSIDEGFCIHGRSVVLNLALVPNRLSQLESFQEFHQITKRTLQIVPATHLVEIQRDEGI